MRAAFLVLPSPSIFGGPTPTQVRGRRGELESEEEEGLLRRPRSMQRDLRH